MAKRKNKSSKSKRKKPKKYKTELAPAVHDLKSLIEIARKGLFYKFVK